MHRHVVRMPADEKRKITRSSSAGGRGEVERFFRDTPAPSATLINESGLYRLIMRSDKASSRPFQDWVTKDVLPAIGRTGGWRVDATASWACQITLTLGRMSRVQEPLKNPCKSTLGEPKGHLQSTA